VPASDPNPDRFLEDLVTLIEPLLEARGFVKEERDPSGAEYDSAICRRFLSPDHIGDRVLDRAQVFFGLLSGQPQVDSLEVVAALDLKGPKSIAANLMNPLKKSARRLRLREPWAKSESADETRTVWSDREGIAGEMMHAIAAEKERRAKDR
jgi:hypothetical protein